MQKKNMTTLLGIAFVVAIAATGIFYGLFVSNLESSQTPARTLVVAARDLPPGTILTEGDLRTIPWPAETLPNGVFESAAELEGQSLFDTVNESEPLFQSRLMTAEGGGRSEGIPQGMRAVSVHVTDSSGVLSLLRSGHRVDVQVVVNQDNDQDVRVRTALEDIEVLSVSSELHQSAQGFDLPVVTLLADPEQAEVLALSDAGGRVRLTLRNPLDPAMRRRTQLTMYTLMQPSGTDDPGTQAMATAAPAPGTNALNQNAASANVAGNQNAANPAGQ